MGGGESRGGTASNTGLPGTEYQICFGTLAYRSSFGATGINNFSSILDYSSFIMWFGHF